MKIKSKTIITTTTVKATEKKVQYLPGQEYDSPGYVWVENPLSIIFSSSILIDNSYFFLN